ncbi:MAG: hypothetical protein Fur0018_15620 [Anaerolineales bacterium]
MLRLRIGRVFFGALLGAVCLSEAVLLGFWNARSSTPPRPEGVRVTVIPLPTLVDTPLPQPTPTTPPSPTALPVLPSNSGTITAGAFVQINGTGGDGLRLRSSPGLDSAVQYVALEAEVFQVQDGPQERDGYTWWFLVAPYDATHQGWAVSNYLLEVQSP